MENIEIVMRMSERLLAVGISGLCIYLGYRLFLSAPTQTNQQGEIELPGMKVVLSRVGPGVFFAAFGAIILAVSFNSPIEVITTADGANITRAAIQTPLDSATISSTDGITQRRSKAINNITLLNCLSQRVMLDKDLQNILPSLKSTISDSKHLWLRQVWDHKNWGPPSALDIHGPTSNATTEFKELYNYVDPTCPQ